MNEEDTLENVALVFIPDSTSVALGRLHTVVLPGRALSGARLLRGPSWALREGGFGALATVLPKTA